MAHFGMSEIVVILVVFVALFGYKKLPDIGRTLGRSIKNFKRSMDEPDEIDITPPADKSGKDDSRKDDSQGKPGQ